MQKLPYANGDAVAVLGWSWGAAVPDICFGAEKLSKTINVPFYCSETNKLVGLHFITPVLCKGLFWVDSQKRHCENVVQGCQ